MNEWKLSDGVVVPEETPAELFPSKSGQISALASANAPILYFEDTPFCGLREAIGSISLTVNRQIGAGPADTVVQDVIIVAHLRAHLSALRRLRSAIDAVLTMAERDQAKNLQASGADPASAPTFN